MAFFRVLILFWVIYEKDEDITMREKIKMKATCEKTFRDAFEAFVVSQTAKGVTEATLHNYHYQFIKITRYLDVDAPLANIQKQDIEKMCVGMRKDGLAHNTIATYVRMLTTFFNWCEREELPSIKIHTIKEKETVKETYTDEELAKLLKRPDKDCDFGEYRCWVIINFLLNSGCRAATVRNIQVQDIDLAEARVIYRHNKNGKIQAIPLCSVMVNILKDYLKVRGGAATDYLFCSVYGDQLATDALRHAICRYNTLRGVESTSIHKFRHTFARRYLVDCGGDAFTLQRLMGHSTLAMTKHYCTIYDADIAKNYDRFSPLAQLAQTKERIRK